MIHPCERICRHSVARGDPDERISGLHPISGRGALSGEHLAGAEALCQELPRPGRSVERQSQPVGLRHALPPVPHRVGQGRVERTQLLRLDPERALECRHGDVGRQLHLLELDRALPLQRAEVFLGVAVDLESREERDVEVARCEAEGAAVVAAHDPDDVVGAEGLLGAAHAGGAVVVRRQRERPGAEHAVVVGEQLRRGLGGAERIEAIVHRGVDSHVAPAGRAHELPQARGAHLRVRRRVEGRLDVRQHGELCGQSEIRQHLRNMGLPGPGADQPCAESVCLAELEADVLGRRVQPGRGALGPPEVLDALVIRRERRVSRSRDPAQRRPIALALAVHDALALPGRGGRLEVQRVVHHGEVVLVVEESRVGVDLRVDADPELHVALELRRARHGAFLARRRGDDETGGKTRGKEGKPPARSGGRPPDRAMQAVRGPCRVHLHSCKIKVPT